MKTEHLCPGCKNTKPIAEFHNRNGCCKSCKAARMRAYRQRNKTQPDYVREQRDYIPLPCEIAFRCAEIRHNWSERVMRARAGYVESSWEVGVVDVAANRRMVKKLPSRI